MDDLGMMALEYGGRVDFTRLRAERRGRCLDQMEAHGIDALVLGREANVRYATGARRLWTAGTRPFAPACIVVGATETVHLVSTWDAGIPGEIDRAHLIGATWNPAKMTESVRAVPGLSGAERIGVDGMTAMSRELLAEVAPGAEIVDGGRVMLAARRHKTADEVACIATAVAVAEAAMAVALDAVAPGVRERNLAGRFLEAMARLGVTTPSTEGTFCVTPRTRDGDSLPLRLVSTQRPLEPGDLVALSGGVLYSGYEGTLARTWPCPGAESGSDGARRLHDRWQSVWDRLAEALRPGATGAELIDAYRSAGEPLPPVPIARGVGLGAEAPVIGPGGGDAVIEAGMTLAVGAYVWAEGVGGYLAREVVLVTDDGPELLTRASHLGRSGDDVVTTPS